MKLCDLENEYASVPTEKSSKKKKKSPSKSPSKKKKIFDLENCDPVTLSSQNYHQQTETKTSPSKQDEK